MSQKLHTSLVINGCFLGKPSGVQIYADELTEDNICLKVYEDNIHIANVTLPSAPENLKLKRAIEVAGLLHYWEYPGKLLKYRTNSKVFRVLASLYYDLTDRHLEDVLRENGFEYDYLVEANLPQASEVAVSVTCDDAWMRMTARIKLNNATKHQRDDLVLTRDYDCTGSLDLETLFEALLEDNQPIIQAALAIGQKAETSYDGVIKRYFTNPN